MLTSLLAITLASQPATAQELRDPGETIREALSAQVTERGLNTLEVVAAELVPQFLGDDVIDLGEELSLGIVTISDIAIDIAVNDVQLVPVPGPGANPLIGQHLRIDVDATLFMNDAGNPYGLSGLCNGDGYAEIDATISLEVELTVVVDPATQARQFEVDLSMPDNGLSIDDVTFFGTCSFLGNLVGGLATGLGPLVQGPIEEQLAGLGDTLADALASARFEDSLEVLDTTIDILIEPHQAFFTEDGIELVFESTVDAPPNDCIEAYDPGGSLLTDTEIPGIRSNPAGTQVAANLSDDMMNQILYAAFRGGVLCFTLDENAEIDLPITLDSSLLGILGGDGYNTIIGEEPKPLIIETLPKKVPEVVYDGEHDVEVAVRELQLGFFTELDYRMARVVGLNLEVDAGVDLDFDASTGQLGIDVALAPSDIQVSVAPDVFVKGSEQDLEDGVSGLIDTVLTSILGDTLEGIGFAIPAFSGVGVTDLAARPAGAGDWLALDLDVGPVTYGDDGAGCDSEGGCDAGCEGGCEGGGCTSARLNLGSYLLFFLPFWMVRRRR